MVHKFDPARMGSLTSSRRQQAVKPLELLRRAGIQAGQLILDWGCGAGFFALPAAELVGRSGKVIAVDLQPEVVAATQAAAAQAGLANLQVMTCGEYDLPPELPAFDWVILAYILHEVRDPSRLIHLAQRTLHPRGRLLLVEWPQAEGPHGPPLAERLAPADLASQYKPLGLEEIAFWEGLPEYYALVLREKVPG